MKKTVYSTISLSLLGLCLIHTQACLPQKNQKTFQLKIISTYNAFTYAIEVANDWSIHDLKVAIRNFFKEPHSFIVLFYNDHYLINPSKRIQESNISATSRIFFYIKRRPLTIIEFINIFTPIMNKPKSIKKAFFNHVILPHITLYKSDGYEFTVNSFLFNIAKKRGANSNIIKEMTHYTNAIKDIEKYINEQLILLSRGYIKHNHHAHIPSVIALIIAATIYRSTYKDFLKKNLCNSHYTENIFSY